MSGIGPISSRQRGAAARCCSARPRSAATFGMPFARAAHHLAGDVPMRAFLALAALLGAANAYADAAATATITNRTPTTLRHADGTTEVIDGFTATVQVGERLSYAFDYHL